MNEILALDEKIIAHSRYKSAPALLYNLHGEIINLFGIDYIKIIPVSHANPTEKKIIYRGATQQELIFIYNEAINKNENQDFLIIEKK